MDAPMTDTRFLSMLRRSPSEDAIREAIATVASQLPRDVAVAAELATILAASGKRLSASGAVVADVAPRAACIAVRDTRSEHTGHVLTAHDGFCFYRLDLLRDRLIEWQNMFRSEQMPFPDPVGLVLLAPPGQWVSGGTPMVTARAPATLMADVILKLDEIVSTPTYLPSGPDFEAIDG